MKSPKSTRRYCKFCKKHEEHKIATAKRKTANTAHPMSYGSKKRAKKRGTATGIGSLGRYSKPPLNKFKMTGKKQTKKTDLRYTCNVCKKTSVQASGIRVKKIEFI